MKTPRLSFFRLPLLAGVLASALSAAEAPVRPAISIRQGDDGKLAYSADAAGNKVIDFSAAGYGGGGEAIPLVPAKIVVAPGGLFQSQPVRLNPLAPMPPG